MSEWKECKLGNIANIQTGPFGSQLHQRDYVDIGTPCIMPTNIGSNLDIITDNIAHIKEEDVKRLGKYCVREGDIIYSRRGDIEKCAFIKKEEEGWLCGTGCLRIRINEKKAIPHFVAYQLSTKVCKKWVVNNAVGTTMPNLNTGILKDLPLLMPPMDTQAQLVSILKSLDDIIAINHHICENVEAQAQALFKHWFIDFAPFKDGKFVESELGLIPEGWRVGKAEDFYTINIGKTPPRAERQWFSKSKENNKIWISISDMGGCGAFISDSKEYLTLEAQSKFNIVMVPKGTVLLSFKLTLGRVAIADTELTTNEAIARFILPDSVYREYTYLYLKQFKYGSLGSTSSIATAVNSKIIKAMPFLMPSKVIMNKYSETIGPLFDEIKNLNQESARLSTLRDTLLPKLMSGELKV